jgi:hypothetical protein
VVEESFAGYTMYRIELEANGGGARVVKTIAKE